MDIVLITKQGIVFQKVKRGEQTVLLIPSPESIKHYKDMDDSAAIAERYGLTDQKPLWRSEEGQAVVYGVLPQVLAQRRQSLKVYLPQDFVPPHSNTFFYVMNPKWVVHGVREIDDEGRTGWRVILLKAHDDESVADLVKETLSERMVENAESKATVAVYDNVALYEDMQRALKPLDVQPVPFSSLKLGPRVKYLYRQRDFTLLMLLGSLVSLAILGMSMFFWITQWRESSVLDDQLEQVGNQIRSIAINRHVGEIHDPNQMLEMMEKSSQQPPSTLLDAAAQFAKEFGKLNVLEFEAVPSTLDGAPIDQSVALEPGQVLLNAKVSDVTNKLLVDQERLARILVNQRAWVRRVENIPQGNATMSIDMVLQTDEKGKNR